MIVCGYYFGSTASYERLLIENIPITQTINRTDLDVYFNLFKRNFFKLLSFYDVNAIDIKNSTVPKKYVKTLNILLFFGDVKDEELKKMFDNEVLKNQFMKYMLINYNTDSLEYARQILDNYLHKTELYQLSPLNNRGANVCVFDLDLTIITRNGALYYPTILHDINLFTKYFDYMILWSNGDTQYVDKFIRKYNLGSIFHIAITRNVSDQQQHNKGLAYILNYLYDNKNITKLNFTCLVDDLTSNFSYDYDVLIRTTINEDTNFNNYYKKVLPKLLQLKNMYDNNNNELPKHLRIIKTKF